MKKMLFSFNDMASGDKASRVVEKSFSRKGSNVVQSDISTSVKRSSGHSYREMTLTFADSQTVVLRVKQTGDIFQVMLNKKALPIKNQDDHDAAIEEIVKGMNAGRTKFQNALARAKVRPPKGIRTTAPKMEVSLTEKRDALKVAIASVREEIAEIRAA
ncbi:hypothetical protein SAMN05216302_104611 [Nitrosomonas aestuarii]|uniref:Defence against restriction A N-terminal domain-containing protein n=1 Tax=Nitrosomonas aestuarii TaxID=52441 RepID=A0A1I4G189_9PROT|nr:hypothetical protein [Nitrosomonas aestuarii]SFL23922.1 hypothetical protein SAMN05216302_104611 [Nitrosomonas aestuarii]